MFRGHSTWRHPGCERRGPQCSTGGIWGDGACGTLAESPFARLLVEVSFIVRFQKCQQSKDIGGGRFKVDDSSAFITKWYHDKNFYHLRELK